MSTVSWEIQLGVGIFPPVDFANMFGISVHVHLGRAVLVSLVEGVDGAKVIRCVPVIALIVPPVILLATN